MQKEINLAEVFGTLEMLDMLQLIQNIKSYEEALSSVKLIQDTAINKRKQLAKKYHPDIVGGSIKKMAEINNAVDLIKTLKAMKHRPKPVMHNIIICHYNTRYGSSWSGFNDSTTSTTAGY